MKSKATHGIVAFEGVLQLVKVPDRLLVVVLLVLGSLVRAEAAVDGVKLAAAEGGVEVASGLIEGIEVAAGGGIDLSLFAAGFVARDQDGDRFAQRGQDLDGLGAVLTGARPAVAPLIDQELKSGADQHEGDGVDGVWHRFFSRLALIGGLIAGGFLLGRSVSALCETPRELARLRRDLALIASALENLRATMATMRTIAWERAANGTGTQPVHHGALKR